MRRTEFMLTLLASASLLVVSTLPEQLWAQTTRERVITEEKVTITTTTVTSPVVLTREIIVQQAPPPPQQETIIASSTEQVWVPGTWTPRATAPAEDDLDARTVGAARAELGLASGALAITKDRHQQRSRACCGRSL